MKYTAITFLLLMQINLVLALPILDINQDRGLLRSIVLLNSVNNLPLIIAFPDNTQVTITTMNQLKEILQLNNVISENIFIPPITR